MKEEDGLDFDINISSAPTKEETSLKNKSSKGSDVEINNSSNSQGQKSKEAIKESIKSIKSNEGINFSNFLKYAHNPGIVFFTIFFKGLAIFLFLFFYFGNNRFEIHVAFIVFNKFYIEFF